MPIYDCPCSMKAGPRATAIDTGYGLTIKSAKKSARENAVSLADDEIIDKIRTSYKCKAGCYLGYFGIINLSEYSQGPTKRAWWTLWIFYRAKTKVTIARNVACFKIEEG